MEKILSEEEKIRRAEEIASRRQNGRIPASNINNSERKVKKLTAFDKLSIQIISSICIFGIIYFISQHNTYAMEKIKYIMSNDTDFQKIYTEISNGTKEIMSKFENKTQDSNNIAEEDKIAENNNQIENQEKQNEDNKNEINENNEQEQTKQNEENSEGSQDDNQNNNETNGIGGGNDETQVSQDVDDITYIKNKLSFIKPVSGVITSPYGERTPTDIVSANHAGVDIGINTGTDIVSAIEGTVEIVSNYGDYGNHVKITNGDISTLYAHCSKIIVNVGEHINQGQKIAESGATGRSTGPHLHFEIRRNNVTVDPQKVVDL